MAILVDFSQVILASIFAGMGNHTNLSIDENTLRHIVLNSLRHNRVKFHKQYGELVICVDGKNTWRRTFFPYYKASRRKSREESELDWPELFRMIGMIKDELAENFPYKVIHLDNAEADDIIGTVVHKYGTYLWDGSSEKHLVLSGDKDYIQLLQYANVEQYNPVLKKYVVHSDPAQYLVEHIIRGDKGDGVPNILSPDNCLIVGERQKTITAKRLELLSNVSSMDEETLRRYERNKKLIDLSQIPNEVQERIIEEYEKPPSQGREKMFNYFIKMKLKNLLTDIQEF